MPKKKRKSPLGKKRKKSKASTRSAAWHGKTRRSRKRRARRTLGNKLKGAYQVVVDTIKGTDQLRNKMEPPATSETE